MTMDYIQMITTNFVIIVGIIFYIFGIIGNILNIYVFTIWSFPRRNLNEHNRANNSSLYLLTSSCANFIQIIYPLLTRIIFDGFQRAKTKENVFYTCQFRYYVLHTSDLISLTCICMATLDRYLISSREVRLRRLSTTKQQTKLLILLIICLFGIHSIPLIIYYDVSNVGNCIINSREYLYYYLCVFQIFLHGIFPILFLSIFGILTYKQLKMLHGNLNGDKQLSRMLLLSCIALLISSIPYCIQNIYSVIFIDFNEELSSYALLFYYISAILFFSNAILSFYIFFISTPNFRKQVKKILQCKIYIRTLGNNRVNAISNVTNGQ